MNSLIHRSTALMLSAALLVIAGLGDALHMLPGMGHAGHCHGLACHAGSGHDHAHSHDGHAYHDHAHASKNSCCGHSHGPVRTSVATVEETSSSSSDESGDAGEQHECGLCKLLASLKQVTPPSVAMHQWQSLSVAQFNSQAQRPESNTVLAYLGRAPPISL
ncbi:hypothetical protein AB1K70_05910 [Bremerella sp. JC770]|uniref:hypothetical protein n=1 Tax=Bremerella sp. JC770 TaxID=3232137 RepID=UPI003459065B